MGLFGLDKPSHREEGTALLTTVRDNVGLAVVRSLLDGAEIPYIIKERGSGSSVKIIVGFSMFGTDIFVPESRLEEALALITPPNEVVDVDESATDATENGAVDTGNSDESADGDADSAKND